MAAKKAVPPKAAAKKTSKRQPYVAPKQELIRIALSEDDMAAMLDRLNDWEHPLYHRLRMRLASYRQRTR